MLRSQVTALLIRLHRLCFSTTSAEVQGYSTKLTSRFFVASPKGGRKTPTHKLLHIDFICQCARSC
jgi:hypothetical protein